MVQKGGEDIMVREWVEAYYFLEQSSWFIAANLTEAFESLENPRVLAIMFRVPTTCILKKNHNQIKN